MEHYAHKRELPGGAIENQTVWAHLIGTARRAGECLRSVGLEKTAYLAGLLHDMGKFTAEFQRYLAQGDRSKRGSVIHTFQGCRYVMERYHREGAPALSVIAAELISFAIGAHHGLFDCVDPARKIGLQYRAEKENISCDEALRGFFSQEISEEEIDRLFFAASGELDPIIEQLERTYADDREYFFAVGLLARLLLSAVIEGDRCDTAAFINGASAHRWPADMTPIWKERLYYLEEKLAQFCSEKPIVKARQQISATCRAFAEKPPGIYRLDVPTGSGKTLSSLRYALAHAARFRKKRLIFTAPLLSILEQNADVIREYVGDDRLILEHHSNVVLTESTQEELDARELLAQSWDAPIIITTLIQLLNTVFAGKTTAIRRFQALCDSVIVIDEVQSVPTKMLTLFNLAISFLSEQCNATIVLCSATQPCLEKTVHSLRHAPEDIVPYDKTIWEVFRRTELCPVPSCCLTEFPAFIRAKMETADSLLVICNKKSEAAYLLENTRAPAYQSFHLSAAMCVQHRRDVLAALQRALAEKEKVLCIATQVMEAGMDISFDAVLRFTAGMDNIVQAAGRCNRNGSSEAPRPVYVANCSDEQLGKLRDIQRGKDAAIALMDAFQTAPGRFANSLFSDASIRYYYQALYRDMEEGEQDYFVCEQKTTLFDLLGMNETYADEDCADLPLVYLRQAFHTAGQAFSVFDEDTTDVLVPYGEGRRLAEELCTERCRYDADHRAAVLKKMNDYTVSVYQYQKARLEREHALHPICDGCALVLADGFYDEIVGMTAEGNSQEYWEV